jgi:hypothetical protein
MFQVKNVGEYRTVQCKNTDKLRFQIDFGALVKDNSYPIQIRVNERHIIVTCNTVAKRRKTLIYSLNHHTVW